jgi:putative ABC transport system permease protein
MYSTTLAREREIAIVRSVGGSRATVAWMIVFEALLIVLIGSLLGRVLGYGAALLIGGAFSERSDIPVLVRFLTAQEAVLWAVPLLIAVCAALLPAALAYRVDVAEKLSAA